MKKLIFIIPLLVLIVLISGCTKKESGTENSIVEIKNAQYKDGNLLLTFYANQSASNVGIDVTGEGKTLCTKHKDMEAGTNHFEFTDCEILENKIKVSATPPTGSPSTKEFSLELPVFKLLKGFRYDYSLITQAGESPREVSIYVTEETSDRWEGIAGMKKGDQRAYLLRYIIGKDDMSLLATEPLNESQILQADVDYINPADLSSDVLYTLVPFFLLVSKEQGLNLNELIQSKASVFSPQHQDLKIVGTEVKDGFLVYKIVATNVQSEKVLVTIYAATTKPYPAVKIEAEGGGLSFKDSEKKDFSTDDYAGYTLEEIRRASLQIPRLVQNP